VTTDAVTTIAGATSAAMGAAGETEVALVTGAGAAAARAALLAAANSYEFLRSLVQCVVSEGENICS